MNQMSMMKAIRKELSVTGEDITIEHAKPRDEAMKRFKEFKNLVKRIGELARKT